MDGNNPCVLRHFGKMPSSADWLISLESTRERMSAMANVDIESRQMKELIL